MDEGDLEESDLLSIMTTNTASITGSDTYFGNLKTGKIASFSVTNGPIFEKKSTFTHSISNGVIYEF
jgi:imidazolonepropionase-like amidohydrolase